MAVINGASNYVEHSVMQTVWPAQPGATALGIADTGSVEQLSRFPVKAFQASGVFGGATVVLEGSEDGVAYFTMTGEATIGGAIVPISLGAAGRFTTTIDNPRFCRPRTSGGDITTAITVTLTSRQFGH